MSGDASEAQVDRVPETPILNAQQHNSQGTPGPATINNENTPIALEIDLERFAALPVSERVLTEPLRYVLVEVALTGVIRYNWSLLRPLVEYLTEQTLLDYDAASNADGPGPNRPAFPGEGLGTTIDRFKSYLGRFGHAPWTLQRLCEVLLAPQTQYTQLHKVALAVEKCLLVTSEVMPTPDPPPAPSIQELAQRPVNANPAATDSQQRVSGGSSGGPCDADLERSTAFTSALLDVHGSPPSGQAAQEAAQETGAGNGSSSGGGHAISAVLASAATAIANANASHHGHHGPHHAGSSAAHAHGGPTTVAGSIPNHHGAHHHVGSHGQGSPGAGISAIEHMEEDHWPDQATLRPGLGGVPPLHGLPAHHLATHHASGTAALGPHNGAAVLPGAHSNHVGMVGVAAGREAGAGAWHGVGEHLRPMVPVGATHHDLEGMGQHVGVHGQQMGPSGLEPQGTVQMMASRPGHLAMSSQPAMTVPSHVRAMSSQSVGTVPSHVQQAMSAQSAASQQQQESSMLDALAATDAISVQQGQPGQPLQPTWQPVHSGESALQYAPHTGIDGRAPGMLPLTAAPSSGPKLDSVGVIAEPMLVDELPNAAAAGVEPQSSMLAPPALPTPVSISAGLPAPDVNMASALTSETRPAGMGAPQLQHLQQPDEGGPAGQAPMEG